MFDLPFVFAKGTAPRWFDEPADCGHKRGFLSSEMVARPGRRNDCWLQAAIQSILCSVSPESLCSFSFFFFFLNQHFTNYKVYVHIKIQQATCIKSLAL